MVGGGTDRRSGESLLYFPVGTAPAGLVLGERRDPRVGLIVILFVALVVLTVAYIWMNR